MRQKLETFYQMRPFFWHIICFILGLILCYLLPDSGSLWLLAILPVFLWSLYCLRKQFYIGLLLFSLLVGCVWGEFRFLREDFFSPYENTDMRITAMVTSEPEATSSGGFSFYCRLSMINGQTESGTKLLVYANEESDIAYGDEIVFYGEPYRGKEYWNLGNFDYDRYLRSQGIAGRVIVKEEILTTGTNRGFFLVKVANQCRAVLSEALAKLPEEQSGVISGILLGDKSGLDEATKNALSHTGLLHAFAVSGLHMGFVLAFAVFLAKRLRLKGWLRVVFTMIILLFYAALADFSPSVMRAFVMTSIGLLAYQIGERKDYFTALAIAAFCSLLYRPDYIINVGFQLSYAAAFGIAYLNPIMQKLLPGHGKIKEAFCVTVSAQLAVMPLLSYYFGIVTLSALLVSPLVCTAAGVIVILGLVAIICSPFGAGIAVYPFYCAGYLGELLLLVVRWMEQGPLAWAAVTVSGIGLVLLYYVCFLLLPYLLAWNGKKIAPAVTIVFMVVLLFIPSNRELFYPMQVYYLDVGEGDATFIKMPGGETVLIDGGGGTSKKVGEYVLLPFLEKMHVKELDVIINTHPHADHTDGLLTVLEAMPVKLLLCSPTFENVPMQSKLVSAALKHNTRVFYIGKDMDISLKGNVKISVLAPALTENYKDNNANDGSLVLRMDYEDLSFLWAGDREKSGLNKLLNENIDVDFVLLPHHGSKGSYVPAFYEATSPISVFISVGKNNSYGHPGSDVTAYFEEKEIPIYRTDENGMIRVFSNGVGYVTESYR